MDYEVISSSNAPPSVGPFSQAPRVGDYIFCAGQAAVLPATGQMWKAAWARRQNGHPQAGGGPPGRRQRTRPQREGDHLPGGLALLRSDDRGLADFFASSPPSRSTVQGTRSREGEPSRSAQLALASRHPVQELEVVDLELDRRIRERRWLFWSGCTEITAVECADRRRGSGVGLGAGPPLLLVHGALGTASAWAPILQQLARRRHVVAVDLPGHGLADPFDYGDSDLLQLARGLSERGARRALAPGGRHHGALGRRTHVGRASRSQSPERVSRLVLAGAPAGIRRPGVPLQLRLLCIPVVGRWLAGRLLVQSDPRGCKEAVDPDSRCASGADR